MSNVQRLRSQESKVGTLDQVSENLSKVGHRSKSLELAKSERIVFDALNRDHRLAYAIFVRDGAWTMKFAVEFPDSTVTQTVERKLRDYALADVAAEADQATEKNKLARESRVIARKEAEEKSKADTAALLSKVTGETPAP